MRKLLCPQCQSEGRKSKVRYNNKYSSLLVARPQPYWNENGDYIDFPLPKVPDFICSNGHEFDDDEYWRTPIEA